MEKTAYRLLKALYKNNMTRGEADSFVGIKDDHELKRRKPVQKAQYIVAIKRYNTVFIGVFLA